MNRWATVVLILLNIALPEMARSTAPFTPADISLPPGFQISLFAENLPNARSRPQVLTEYCSWEHERSAGFTHLWIGTETSRQTKRSFWPRD